MKDVELTLSDLKMGYPDLIKEAEDRAYNRGFLDGQAKGRADVNREGRASAFLEKARAANYSPAGEAWEREGFFSESGYLSYKKAFAAGLVKIIGKEK